MTTDHFFFNRAGRIRSGWRLAAFFGAFLLMLMLLLGLIQLGQAIPFLSRVAERALADTAGFITQGLLLLIPATLVGWACNRVLEDLPWRALGWTLHRGWLRDALVGAVCGGFSVAVAVLMATALGGFNFTFSAAATVWPAALWRTLFVSGLVFAVGAAAEEALFRGYPLQTLLRSWPAWAALLPSSLLFASVHLFNPHTVRGFTFFNTALAGVWLAVAYLRTRSLWFPLGVHWGWNWTMGSLLGLPVSGITQIAPAPLLRATDAGPAWLTGGSYGIEGGAVCTLALLLSTIFIWRTRLVSATEELKQMTDGENPAPAPTPFFVRGSGAR